MYGMHTGTLPPVWADPLAFPSLSTLLLGYTLLTGYLPASWGSNGSFEPKSDGDHDVLNMYITGKLGQHRILSQTIYSCTGTHTTKWDSASILGTKWISALPGNTSAGRD